MKLCMILLILTVVLFTGAQFLHEDFKIEGCSATEEELMFGSDGEEVWHADYNRQTGVETLPDFGDPDAFPGFYQYSVEEMKTLKYILKLWIKTFKSPPEALDPPQTSIYSKDDVQLGVENTLICHVTDSYPPSVNVSWTRNNVLVTEGVSLSQYRPMNDGTFNMFSTLKIIPEKRDVYSCTVKHKALQDQPQTKIWDVDVAVPSVGPSVFCGVGLTLGLLGLATGTFFFIKGNNYY